MTNKINFIFNPSSVNLCALTEYNGVPLNANIRQVYTYLLGFHINGNKDKNGKPVIHPSTETIARMNGMSNNTAFNCIKALQKAGMIKGTIGANNWKSYEILVTPDMLPAPGEVVESKEEAVAVVEEKLAPVTTEESVQAAEEFIEVVETVQTTTTAQEFLATVTEEPASLVPSLEELLASAPVVDVAKVKAEAVARSKAKEEEAAIIAKEKAQYEAGTLKATRSLFNK